MGSSFSNLHIRTDGELTLEKVKDFFTDEMNKKHYKAVSSPEEADCVFAFFKKDNDSFISVYSDCFSFENPESFTEQAKPIIEQFGTEVLGIFCFDSDYLYLNLLGKDIDAWASIGSSSGLGISRRKKLSAWSDSVENFSLFKEKLKQKYCFCEEVLWEIEPCLKLSASRTAADFETLEDFPELKKAELLCFALTEEFKTKEPPRFSNVSYTAFPQIDEPNLFSVINEGGASKGITVMFIGKGLQNDELIPKEVSLFRHSSKEYELKGEKVKLKNGEYGYVFRCPTFPIPEKVNDKLPQAKYQKQREKNEIVLRYSLKGNARKLLDFDILIYPDKNKTGLMSNNLWKASMTKKEFIDFFKEKFLKNPELSKISAEDFD